MAPNVNNAKWQYMKIMWKMIMALDPPGAGMLIG